jgi:hypothetical protein
MLPLPQLRGSGPRTHRVAHTGHTPLQICTQVAEVLLECRREPVAITLPEDTGRLDLLGLPMLARVLFLLSVLLWLSACGTRAPSPKPGRADSGVDLGVRDASGHTDVSTDAGADTLVDALANGKPDVATCDDASDDGPSVSIDTTTDAGSFDVPSIGTLDSSNGENTQVDAPADAPADTIVAPAVVDSAQDASLDAGIDAAGDATKDLADVPEDVTSVIVTVSDGAPGAAANGAADTSTIPSPLDATIDSETEVFL